VIELTNDRYTLELEFCLCGYRYGSMHNVFLFRFLTVADRGGGHAPLVGGQKLFFLLVQQVAKLKKWRPE